MAKGVGVTVTVSRNDLLALAKKAEAVLGHGHGLEFAWRGVGNQAQGWAQGVFRRRSKGETVDGVAWTQLASVTVLFRRGVKVTTVDEFLALGSSKRVEILSENETLARGFVVETIPAGVQVRVTAPYASDHQEGSTSSLTFRELPGDLELVSGRPGEPLLSQHVARRLGSSWNPDFFKIRHILMNMQGAKSVPARPVITEPNESTVKGWLGNMEKAIEVALGAA